MGNSTSPFIHKKTVDSMAGKTEVEVYVDGVKCTSFQLTGPNAKKYVSLDLIIQDLLDARYWLKKAHSMFDPVQKDMDQSKVDLTYAEAIDEKSKDSKAFFFSAIVIYAKCFVTADGRGLKLEKRDHVSQDYLSCHERIMSYRHGLVAHAGSVFDNGEVILALHPTNGMFNVRPNLWRLDFEDDRKSDIDFASLIEHVLENTYKASQKVLNRILENDGKEAAKKKRAELKLDQP